VIGLYEVENNDVDRS